MELAAILKPGPFVKTEAGDPEQLLQDFKEYVKRFRKYLLATGMAGVPWTTWTVQPASRPRLAWSW